MGANEERRLMEIICGVYTCNGAATITLTKAKGHATQEIVDEGREDEERNKGNDGADDGANKGAEGEQHGLSTVARQICKPTMEIQKIHGNDARLHHPPQESCEGKP